jgi:hypothetical protein
MDPLIIVIIASAIERTCAVIIGGASIYWGWKLFYIEAKEAHSEAKLDIPYFKVSLKRVAPGVLFAAFGCAVVIASFFYPVRMQDGTNNSFASTGPGGLTIPGNPTPTPNPSDYHPTDESYEGAAGSDPELQNRMQAEAVVLNQVLQIIQQRDNNDPDVLSARINNLAKAQTVIKGIRDSIVESALGTKNAKLWAADGSKYLADPNAFGKLNPETAELAAIAPWYSTQPLQDQ